MGIPNKLSPLTGGEGILPKGYLPAEFLESPSAYNAQTLALFDLTTEDVMPEDSVQYETEHYFTQLPTIASVEGWGENKCNLRWGYLPDFNGWTVSVDGIANNSSQPGNSYADENIMYSVPPPEKKWFKNTLSISSNVLKAYIDNEEVAEFGIIWHKDAIPRQGTGVFGLSKLAAPYYSMVGRKKSYTVIKNGNIINKLVPCVAIDGEVAFFDTVTKKTVPRIGAAFIVGMTPLQARNLRKLPIVESSALTVSLPWEAQWDAGVQNALSIAATRGWTITVQYRDPEVTTTNIPASFLESTGNAIQSLQSYISLPVEINLQVDSFAFETEHELVQSDTAQAEVLNTFDPMLFYGMRANGFAYYGIGYKNSNTVVDGTLVTPGYNVFRAEYDKGTARFSKNSVLDAQIQKGIPQSEMIVRGIGVFCALGKPVVAPDSAGFAYPFNGRKKYFKVWVNNELKRHLIPALDSAGVPCMYDSVHVQNFYNAGTGSFIAGFDTVEQARNLAYLPDVTAETDASKNSLTVSLPWEAQLVITGVPAALQVAADRGWTITVQYRDPEADNAYYNKYAACKTAANMQAVNADYMNDLTAEGDWIYPLNKLNDATSVFYGAKALKIWRMNLPAVSWINDGFRESGLTEFNAVISASNINAILYSCNNLVQIELNAPNATMGLNAFGNSPAKRIKVNLPALQDGWVLCNKCSNLEDFDGTLPRATNLTSAFSGCILNKASVLRITDSLQSFTDGTSHALTIGIHSDYQTDAEVLAAIEATEAKGWTVTVQWNGTATAQAASMYGLRSQPIYAKLIEYEDNSSLDWGHYVTNWEQNGYQEFSSLEEAEEYFNINQTEEV